MKDSSTMPESTEQIVGYHDAHGLRMIIAELGESAARINVQWALALAAEDVLDRDLAMTHLANITTELGIVLVQVEDIRSAAEAALDRLEVLTEQAK